MFFNSMILGTMITISSYSWFMMWMGLEINLISVIPLFNNNKNMYSSEVSMKYFITQSIASLTLLISIIMMISISMIKNLESMFNSILMISMLMKMGAAPMHFWFPEVMEGLSWMNSIILLTWQKIAPMVIFMMNKINKKILIISVIACLLISATMVMNQISLRKIMAFSSINHIAWMLSSMLTSLSSWIMYFIIYSMTNILLIINLFKYNIFFINQLFSTWNTKKNIKMMTMMNFLSLGGLPPFIGFIPKWIIINQLNNINLQMINFLLIIFSLALLYIYLNLTISSLMLNFTEFKLYKFNSTNKYISIFNLIFLFSALNSIIFINFN
uniref:NADH-ubiquinone oxidoreductase chain 2 n=1 Tax=Derodontidae sp. BMNH 899913 TaxID=1903806 RepID=A0A343A4F7_9COLE|nr:NADH dehydrogenase subunit 2 [Derodontidae sp. BMNH 899913]